MKKYSILIVLFSTMLSFAQSDAVALINEGNDTYKTEKYTSAEENYRLAVSKADTITAGQYDLANAIYKQKRLNEAGAFYQKTTQIAQTKTDKAKAYHNLGNVYFQKGKLEEAIAAYKNSLRNNPADEETRYNLALAKELLKKKNKNKKQQNKDKEKDKDKKDDKKQDKDKKDKDKKDDKKQDKDKEKDKDKKDDKKQDKDKKDKDKKDDKKQDKDKKDKDKKDDKKQDKDKKDKDKKDDKKQGDDKKDKGANKKQDKNGKPQKAKLSPQEAKRLLAAIQNEEDKTQKKVKAQQVQGVPVKTEKDW